MDMFYEVEDGRSHTFNYVWPISLLFSMASRKIRSAKRLLDANGDGEIDTRDPREFSFYQHGKGSSSQTAMAPHFMVAAACNQLMAYR